MNTPRHQIILTLKLLAAVVLWGASFAMLKIAVTQAPFPLVAVARVLIGVPVLLAAVIVRKRFRFPKGKEWLILAFLGFQGIMFHQVIQAFAMRTAGSSNGNWLIATSPCITSLFGWIFLKEWLSFKKITGMMISAFGVLLILGFGTRGMDFFNGFATLGNLVMFGSVFNWAAFQILSRHSLRSIEPTFALFWLNAWAGFFGVVWLGFVGISWQDVANVSWPVWGAILYLGVLASAVAYLFWYDGLASWPVARVAAFQFLQPVVGLGAGYLLVGERFTLWMIAGGILIFFGVWCVNRSD